MESAAPPAAGDEAFDAAAGRPTLQSACARRIPLYVAGMGPEREFPR